MDSKNIKDYLHLYLGQQCRCYNHADREGWLETISCTIIIEYGDEDSEIEGIVPILRPLSDMTEDESRCFHSFGGRYSIVNPKYAINQIFGANLFYEGDNGIQIAHLTQHLLSKGFDLFGLIDAGLAIKKSQ